MGQFDWVNFYKAFAIALVNYKDKRSDLIQMIKKIYKEIGIHMSTLERDRESVIMKGVYEGYKQIKVCWATRSRISIGNRVEKELFCSSKRNEKVVLSGAIHIVPDLYLEDVVILVNKVKEMHID